MWSIRVITTYIFWKNVIKLSLNSVKVNKKNSFVYHVKNLKDQKLPHKIKKYLSNTRKKPTIQNCYIKFLI